MQEVITISGLLKEKGEIKKGQLTVDKSSGLITDVQYGHNALLPKANYVYSDEYLIQMGDFNAHSHPEQSLYVDIVDKNWDLPTWCRNTIYKYSPSLTEEHIYLACCRAFSRMLRLGITSVMVSFYCHNNRGNLFDKQVIKAAIDTGIRLYFGRMNYDIINHEAYDAKKNSQKCYFETPTEAEKHFCELLAETNHPNVVIAPSIHSIHASTKAAIISAINLGNTYDRYVQFHLSEDRGDVTMSLDWYNYRPIRFLVELLKQGEITGLENLILSDCVWIDQDERKLIKEYGMKVVLNPRMNARIKTGEADFPALLAEGIDLYLGTDGEASNDDLSITHERDFLCESFPEIPVDLIANIGQKPLKFNAGLIGDLHPGHFCDLKITYKNKVTDVFVGGKQIVTNGQLTTLDVTKEIEKPLKLLINKLS